MNASLSLPMHSINYCAQIATALHGWMGELYLYYSKYFVMKCGMHMCAPSPRLLSCSSLLTKFLTCASPSDTAPGNKQYKYWYIKHIVIQLLLYCSYVATLCSILRSRYGAIMLCFNIDANRKTLWYVNFWMIRTIGVLAYKTQLRKYQSIPLSIKACFAYHCLNICMLTQAT